MPDAAEPMKARLRTDLKAAMQAKDALRTSLLRTLIAALDNAQAVPVGDAHQRYQVLEFGDRSGEVARRELDDAAVADLLRGEVAARRNAAEEMATLGQPEPADRLRAEAAIAEGYLAGA